MITIKHQACVSYLYFELFICTALMMIIILSMLWMLKNPAGNREAGFWPMRRLCFWKNHRLKRKTFCFIFEMPLNVGTFRQPSNWTQCIVLIVMNANCSEDIGKSGHQTGFITLLNDVLMSQQWFGGHRKVGTVPLASPWLILWIKVGKQGKKSKVVVVMMSHTLRIFL